MKRTKTPALDLTVGERLTIEVLRQQARQSCDDLLIKTQRKWKSNMLRDLRYLAAVGAIEVEQIDGVERYSITEGAR